MILTSGSNTSSPATIIAADGVFPAPNTPLKRESASGSTSVDSGGLFARGGVLRVSLFCFVCFLLGRFVFCFHGSPTLYLGTLSLSQHRITTFSHTGFNNDRTCFIVTRLGLKRLIRITRFFVTARHDVFVGFCVGVVCWFVWFCFWTSSLLRIYLLSNSLRSVDRP